MNEILYEISWQNLLLLIATIDSGDHKERQMVTVDQLESLLS